MQVVLVMFRADGERRSFSVVRDMTVIGRREDCDLRIPLGEVSRKHCRFIKDADSIRVEDLGSSNGTYHNGQRVQEATLGAGDTLQIGPVTFLIQIDGVPADEDMHAATGEAADQAAPDFFPVEEPAGPAGAMNSDAEESLNFDPAPGGAGVDDDLSEFEFDEEPAPNDRPA